MNQPTGSAGPVGAAPARAVDAPPARPPYRDPGLGIDARVADLLARMTLAEKLAQLGSIWAFEIVGPDGVERDRLAPALGDGLGAVSRLAGSTNLRATEVAAAANELQRYLVEETRLGIPALIHEECLHGLMARDALCFQQSIGAAAAWDPALTRAMADTIRRRMLATGARHALGPVLDTTRDPRWGRIEETYGEDPYLAAELGTAYIRGLQGPDLSAGIVATGKHMVGHGLAEGGLNQAPAHAGPRELRDEQLFPFEAAVRDAGLAGMMPAYCDVDGVPCHASHELLTAILRDEWGFDGIVASDYTGIAMLSTLHGLTDHMGTAATLAIRAGVDSELPRTAAFGAPLAQALHDGHVDQATIDLAVGRMLRIKVRLGLFEQPYIDVPGEAVMADLGAEEARVALELARRSLVLTANRGMLPVAPATRRIAVLGPIAASARDLIGDYSHLVHIETLQGMRTRDNAFGVTEVSVALPVDELAGRRTILDAIRARFSAAEVRHARGTGLAEGSDEEIAQAVELAAAADVAIVVLGERSGLTDDSTTGEFRDRQGLGFIGRQQELLEAVVATRTPVILVVVSGRPLTLGWAAEHCAAILLAWVPGDAGPEAIAEILAGDVEPGGRLPVTMPRHVGQVPLTYRHHASGGRSNPRGDHVDGSATPLWPFGFGLSYTSFELANLRLSAAQLSTAGGEVVVSAEVRNIGGRPGETVVQLYVHDEEATVARPVLELRGFARVAVEAGATRTVAFSLSSEQLAYVGLDYRRIVEPGRVAVSVGLSSADRPLKGTIELVGPTVELRDRTRYFTGTTIS